MRSHTENGRRWPNPLVPAVALMLATPALANNYLVNGCDPFDGFAAEVNGVNQFVVVQAADEIVMTEAFTLEAWIYPTGAGSGAAAAVVDKGGEYVLWRASDGEMHWAVANTDPGWVSIPTDFFALEDEWTHLALVYDATAATMRLYANGQLRHERTVAGLIGDVDPGFNELRFGTRGSGVDANFEGRIEEVKLWNRALPQEDVLNNLLTERVGDEDGLVGYWRFDEGSGIAADLAGENNIGVFVGAVPAPTATCELCHVLSGGALDLDGVDDYVQVGPAPGLVLVDQFTIEAWIYPTADKTGIIVNKEGEYEIERTDDGSIRWAIANTTPGWDWRETGFNAPLHEWSHIALAYTDGLMRFYANGEAYAQPAASGLIGDAAPEQNDFRIGGRQASAAFNFDGRIDEVRVWDDFRPQSDIQATMNMTLTGSEFGLIGYWRLDEGDGVTTEDLAGGNDGTLVGAFWRETLDCSSCVGDLDETGDVGFTDLIAILGGWGPCAGCAQDLDASGDVGFTDLLAVLTNWGPCP